MLYVLIIGSVLIIAAGIVFRVQLANISPKWLLVFAAGVLTAIGTQRAVSAARDLKRKIPL